MIKYAGVGLVVLGTILSVCHCNLDWVPIGKFEATDKTDNFANYRNSMLTEFNGFDFRGLRGKLIHEFSPALDGKNTTYFHSFYIPGTSYKQNLTFELGVERTGNYNGTVFKYKYYFLPEQGFHADYHVPEDNPLPIKHLYVLDEEGFALVYRIGEVVAIRWYKRLPINLTPAKVTLTSKRTTAVSAVRTTRRS